jgi:uncharacterized protein
MDASLTPWLWTLAIVLVAVGVAGAVLPALPGVPLVFLGLWLAAWIDGYQKVSVLTLVVLGLLAILAMLLDFMAGALGAKRVGASRQAITGAVLGSVVGMFFGLPGLLIGPFAGALVGELSAQSSLEQATRVGVAAWVGFVLGTLAKLALSLTMLGVFLFAYFL